MIVLGITGGTGGGKTTLLGRVAARGGAVIDCDEVYHALLSGSPAMRGEIAARFPAAFADGALDRRKLGALVFGDAAALRALNGVTHRYVRAEVERRLAAAHAAGRTLAAVDAIGLFESGLGALCDRTIAVVAPREARIARLTAREGVSAEYAALRIDAQEKDETYAARCGETLVNDCQTVREFAARCDELLDRILGGINMSEKKYDKERKALLFQPKNGYDRLAPQDAQAMEDYCAEYLRFVGSCKTEREAVADTVAAAERAGFRAFRAGESLNAGDKLYYVNRQKSVFFAVIGSKPLESGARVAVAHIDSPRLDIKPNPLYEEGELAMFKTHYYGGIKKYQWTALPLALHGVLALTDGSVVKVSIGEEPGDPQFCVSDLLVHLSQEQMKKTLSEGISAESLNVLLGSRPLPDDEGGDRVRLAVMLLLHDKYGITEEDFLSAELTMVPALPAREVGLDRSLLGAYGHDDRVCAWAIFRPLLDGGVPAHTSVCWLADKEEIGSDGVTGAQSAAFDRFMAQLCRAQNADLRECLAASVCLSCDVTSAYDPNYADAFDRRNAARLNYGVGICKYTGARGKSGASDAAGEVMARFRRLFTENGVIWQTSELGRVDLGGGGTVAKYMANRNIDTLDAGVPLLSMHAPWEIASKLDCYMTMKAGRAFYGME